MGGGDFKLRAQSSSAAESVSNSQLLETLLEHNKFDSRIKYDDQCQRIKSQPKEW